MQFMKEKGIVVSQVHARNDRHSCLENFKSTLNNLNKIEEQENIYEDKEPSQFEKVISGIAPLILEKLQKQS